MNPQRIHWEFELFLTFYSVKTVIEQYNSQKQKRKKKNDENEDQQEVKPKPQTQPNN